MYFEAAELYKKGYKKTKNKAFDLNLGLSGYYGLNQSPEFQQINFDNKDFNTDLFYNLYTSFSYKSLKGSVGAVDAEKGIKSCQFAINWEANPTRYVIVSQMF